MKAPAVDIASVIGKFTPARAKGLLREGGDRFETILSRVGDGENLMDLTADRTLPTPPQSATPATGKPTFKAPDSDKAAGKEVTGLGPLPDDATPIQRLEEGLRASGQPLEEMTLPKEAAVKLEEILVKSGYDRNTARQIIKRATDEDGNINMGALFRVMADYQPSESPLLSLPVTDKPLLIQALQELGLDPQKVREFVESLPVKGHFIDLTGIGKLLSGAGDQAKQVEPSVLRDLLTGLGLSKEEADALIVKSADSSGRFSPQDLLAMLKAAASTQSSALSQSLKELAARIKVGDAGGGDNDAAKLKAQVQEILRSGEGGAKAAENATTVDKAIATAKNTAADPQQVVQAARAQAQTQTKAQLGPRVEDNKGVAAAKTENQGFKEMFRAAEGEDPQLQRETQRLARAGQNEQAAAISGSKGEQGRTVAAAAPSARANPEAGGQSMGEAQIPAGARAVSGAAGGRAVLPAHVVRQVSAQIANMAKNNQQVMRIALRPAHLGGLKMTLQSADGAVKATLAAESLAAKGILESGLGQLRESLAAQGIKVERLEVIVDPDAQRGQNQASAQEQGERAGGRNKGRGPDGGNGDGPLFNQSQESDAAGRENDGRLSVFA